MEIFALPAFHLTGFVEIGRADFHQVDAVVWGLKSAKDQKGRAVCGL